jgi:hypothetical protein
MHLVVMEDQTTYGGSENTGTSTDKVKPLTFDGSIFWAVFHHQFEAVANKNDRTSCKKTTHLLTVHQGQPANDLHSNPAETTHEDTVRDLTGSYRDHQQAAAYQVQLKARIQLSGASSQDFAAAVKQVAYWALVRLPVDFI